MGARWSIAAGDSRAIRGIASLGAIRMPASSPRGRILRMAPFRDDVQAEESRARGLEAERDALLARLAPVDAAVRNLSRRASFDARVVRVATCLVLGVAVGYGYGAPLAQLCVEAP